MGICKLHTTPTASHQKFGQSEYYAMHGSRKFCQVGSNFDNFFSLIRRERIDDGPTLNAGLVAL